MNTNESLIVVRGIMQKYGRTLEKVFIPSTGDTIYGPSDFKEEPHYKCGPNKNKILTALIPDKVYFNREAPCKVHDHMYTYPENGKDDWKECADLLFKVNMDLIAACTSKSRFGKYLAVPFNNMFYYFVKWWGKSSFYSDKS